MLREIDNGFIKPYGGYIHGPGSGDRQTQANCTASDPEPRSTRRKVSIWEMPV
jgi:hypothetical protein